MIHRLSSKYLIPFAFPSVAGGGFSPPGRGFGRGGRRLGRWRSLADAVPPPSRPARRRSRPPPPTSSADPLLVTS